jgi:hypothetical protein
MFSDVGSTALDAVLRTPWRSALYCENVAVPLGLVSGTA